MSGLLKTQIQLGDSAIATQNFTLTSAAADGTMKLARGNSGATTQDILTVDASGNLSTAQTVSVGAATAAAHAVRLDQAGRRLAQIVTYTTGTMASGTTALPFDNTIPQNTEGDQYLSLAITPTNTNSTLEISVVLQVAHQTAGMQVGAALFQDATANALAAMGLTQANTAASPFEIAFTHIMTAGTTSSTTFKVRAGGNTGATLYVNGAGGTQIYGGVQSSRITIKEYLP